MSRGRSCWQPWHKLPFARRQSWQDGNICQGDGSLDNLIPSTSPYAKTAYTYLFECLAHTVAITPNGLHNLLLKLGYDDISDYKEVPKEEVYVCYVQNYYGFTDGEDVVEKMRIFSSQAQIDQWFCEQVEKGKKEGYVPEEETTEFIGMNDYELTMTLTKDGIGAASFGIVCKPFEIERWVNKVEKMESTRKLGSMRRCPLCGFIYGRGYGMCKRWWRCFAFAWWQRLCRRKLAPVFWYKRSRNGKIPMEQ